jgi:catechol 2,3-dioxygenase-like lactoylglutathione lyase family enzyme
MDVLGCGLAPGKLAVVTRPLRHVTITRTDLPSSLAFYDATLAELGLQRFAEYSDEEEPDDADVEAVGYGIPGDDAVLWVVAGSPETRGVHIALTAGSPARVDAFFRTGVMHGGSARQAPRRWEIFRTGYYGAQLTDPADNVIEAVSPE